MRYLNQTEQIIMDDRSTATGTVNTEPSKTLQGPAAECDINRIVKALGPYAPIPTEVTDPRYYGDLSDVPDLQTALDRVREATERFQALPSALRSKFNNSPADLWEFVSDPRNAEESVNLGLLKRLPEPQKAPDLPAPQAPETGPKTGT